MKRSQLVGGLCAFVLLGRLTAGSSSEPVLIAGPIVAGSGPHHRTIQQVWQYIDAEGQLAVSTNSHVELATGLNYPDSKTGQWIPAKAEFELTRTGYFIARQTQHQVILSPDPTEEWAVDFLGPDGVRLRSKVLGIAVVDPKTGNSALLAELKQTKPDWVGPGEVIYADAFDSVAADLRYSISLDRFEQDIILREQIPPEVVDAVGIDPRSARVLLMTEFFDPPQPARTARSLALADGTVLTDEELDFGLMRIGRGNVFRTDESGPALKVPVGKSWEQLEGRQFLIESVPYVKLGELLDGLPMPGQARLDSIKAKLSRTAKTEQFDNGGNRRTASVWTLPLPERKTTTAQARAESPGFKDGKMVVTGPTRSWDSLNRLASRAQHQPGVVLDYVTLNGSQTNYTFKADTTYHVIGPVGLYQTTTLEGGAVVKFTNSASAQISIYGPVNCQTGPYRPVVFTARDDNTVGEKLNSNTPSGYYGNGLRLCTSGQALSNLRFAFADKAVTVDYAGGTLSLTNVQFVNCQTGCEHEEVTLRVRNGLFHRVTYVSGGYCADFQGEHLTVHQCGTWFSRDGYLYLTNCLVTALTNGWGSAMLTTNRVVFSTSEIPNLFAQAGAGYHYLANNCVYRDYGTTNINPGLAAQLKSTTTYPPVVMTGLLTTQTRLDPQAARDIDLPDLGYHYPPIDYAVGTLTVTNYGSLRLGPGVAVASYGDHGLRIENYGSLVAEGAPTAPLRLFRYNVIQEQPIDWGNSAYEPAILTGPCHDTLGGDAPPVATLRFVEFSGLGGYGNHLYTDNGWFMFKQLSLQDCVMWDGKAQFSGTTAATIGLTNNLFVRTANKYYAWPILSAYNNLFWGGSNRFDRYSGGGTWTFRDNAFHDTGLTNVNASVVNDHNAYIGTGQYGIGGSGGGDVVTNSFTYTNSYLGNFYHLSTNLIDRGSRSASAAGLYHYTVRADQTKETNSTVDIGFHYVATDASGNPLDYDGDSLPDHFEDKNGNGTVDSGETNWQQSENGTTGVPGLQLHTPLEQ